MKKLISVLLCAAMIFSLLACAAPAAESTETVAPATEADQTTTEAVTEREPVVLNLCFLANGSKADELKKVQDAINVILKEKYNTTVTLTEISLADYSSKMELMLSAGEKVDLFQGFLSYDNYVASGYLLPLENYETQLKDAIALSGDYVNMARSNGHLWGIPAVKDIASGHGYIFAKKYVDETGMKPEDIVDYETFGQMLYKMKELHPEMTPIYGPLTAYCEYGPGEMIDKLGSDQLLGVLLEPTTSSTVENFYTSKRFTETCEYAYKWNQDGLITFDGNTDYISAVRAGTAMGTYYVWTPKAELEATMNVGQEMVFIKPNQSNALSTTSNYFTWCIPEYCEEPERACEVLNEFFVNKELNNLLAWGIEGEDYEVVDANSGSGVIKFPEGLDSTSVGYYQFTKFGFFNNFLQYVLEGTDPEQWSKMDEFNKNSDISIALGFSFDASSVANQIAACTNIVKEYSDGLLSGEMDPSEKLAEFQSKLEENGIEDIIAAKQAQLDAWIKGNKN